MAEKEKYKRFMLFCHHGVGSCGGYNHGLDAIKFHSNSYGEAEVRFNAEALIYSDVKLLDRKTGEILLSYER